MYSRAVPLALVKPLSAFLACCDTLAKLESASDRHFRAANLVKALKDATAALPSASGKATSLGLRLAADGLSALSKLPSEPAIAARGTVMLFFSV